MLKAFGHTESGRPILVAVLENRHFDYLREGRCILLNLRAINPAFPDADVILHYSENIPVTKSELQKRFPSGIADDLRGEG